MQPIRQIPLQEGERAVLEDGIEAMATLVKSLRNSAALDGRRPRPTRRYWVSAN